MTIFHLSIGFVGPAVAVSEIQNALPSGCGWARYAPNCWLVDTDVSAEQLAKLVRAKVTESDSVFVVKLELGTNFGYLQKEIWDWINKRSR